MKPLRIHSAGTRIAGKFRVLRLLGTGGMGAVYEVENERLAKRYALKVLHTDDQTSPELVQRFQREIKADGRIRNAHIVEVHDDGVLDTGEPYVVMELLEGETLASMIERKGPLDLQEMCDIIGQACAGVQAAHDAGIIHRDLKPENLFVCSREGKPFVKLLDFGIAKFQNNHVDDMTATREGVLLGTPYYWSPEQIRKNADIDARCDVYALGVILYECATGRVPYRADTLPLLGVVICEGKPEPLSVLRPDLPEEFRNCILQALAVERERRTPSAQLLGATLRAIAARTHAELPSPISNAASNSPSTNSAGDLMRSTEMIEEPLEMSRAPITNENGNDVGRPSGRASMGRRPLSQTWLVATFALLAGIGVAAFWMGMTRSQIVAPINAATSGPNTTVTTLVSVAAPSASSTATEPPPKTENTGPTPSTSASARAPATSKIKASPGTNRAKELGINPKLPP